VDLDDSKTDESKQYTFLYQALAVQDQKFGAEKLWPFLSSCPEFRWSASTAQNPDTISQFSLSASKRTVVFRDFSHLVSLR
jgi:hypothetical protein